MGALMSYRFRWIVGDISSMPRRNATGVVCIFLIWGLDDVCIILFSVKLLTVTCAGLSLLLVLIVVFLVVRDRSKRKVSPASCNFPPLSTLMIGKDEHCKSCNINSNAHWSCYCEGQCKAQVETPNWFLSCVR
jgi:hypothetical protein